MTVERRNKLVFRWSITSSIAIALFWLVWYLIEGSVPVVHEFQWAEDSFRQLPFAISRWWDVLLGPVFSFSIVNMVYFYSKDDQYKEEDPLLGFFFGFVLGLVFGFSTDPILALFLGLVFGLAFWRSGYPSLRLAFVLAFGLGLGLVSGIFFGLIYVFFFGLLFGIAAAREPFFNWLMVR